MNTSTIAANAGSKLKAAILFVKSQILSFLKFSRIVGEDGHIDWTTTSLVAVIFLLVFKVSSPGIGEIGALLLTLLARAHKKYLGSKADERHTKLEAVVKAAKEQIQEVNANQDTALVALKAELAAVTQKAQKAQEFMGELNTRLGLSDFGNFQR